MYPGPEIHTFSLEHIIGKISLVTRIIPFYLTGYNVTERNFIFLIEINSQEYQLASGISIISLTYQLFELRQSFLSHFSTVKITFFSIEFF